MTAQEFKNTIISIIGHHEFIEESKSAEDYSDFLIGLIEKIDVDGKEYEVTCKMCKEQIDLSCANVLGNGYCFCDECIATKLDEILKLVETDKTTKL